MENGGAWLVVVNAGFTSGVCALIAVHGVRLVQFEYVDRTLAFAGVPVWALEIIIPFAFAVIALRYVIYAFSQWRADEVPGRDMNAYRTSACEDVHAA